MRDFKEPGLELEEKLRLKTRIVSYKKLERAEDLGAIPDLKRLERSHTFCQIPDLVRVYGWTIGVTRQDKMGARCMNMCGLQDATEDGTWVEAAVLATTWMPSHEESVAQQKDYPRMPAGQAIVLAPLTDGKFEPDVVMVYGNPAQLMMLLCGLQKVTYESFPFVFLGEGDCSSSLARCYVTGRPALGLGCYGERAMGQMQDDEIVLALPPGELERAVMGLRKLADIGFRYPIRLLGAGHDPFPELAEFYPPDRVGAAIAGLPKRPGK